MLRALFTDPAFGQTRGQLVKQPVEWMVGALRQLGVAASERMLSGLNGLGQVPLRPPSVGGWPAGAAWLTTASLQERLRLAAVLAAAASPATVDSLGAGDTPVRLAALARLLAVDSWTDRTRAALADAAGDARRLLTVGLISPEYTVT
jgi:uncharacterized protein (DUF1800 family)